ncbi:hypothetical protein, partial [Salmonella enterica]
VPAYGPQNDVTLKMPAFEWVHVQLHQQKGMISLSPPTICNSAHNTIKSGVKLKLVWLERGHTKADIVADVLATAGFPDFGDQLKLLATSSLQKTHKLA